MSAIASTEAELLVHASVVEHRRGFRHRWYRTPSFVAGVAILGLIVLAARRAADTRIRSVEQDLLHTCRGRRLALARTDDLGRDVRSALPTARTTSTSRSRRCRSFMWRPLGRSPATTAAHDTPRASCQHRGRVPILR
jgi:hypothetical protein